MWPQGADGCCWLTWPDLRSDLVQVQEPPGDRRGQGTPGACWEDIWPGDLPPTPADTDRPGLGLGRDTELAGTAGPEDGRDLRLEAGAGAELDRWGRSKAAS